METYPLANASSAARTYVITRSLAQEAVNAVDLLESDPDRNGHVANKSCWRNLTVRKWFDVQALERKLLLFLQNAHAELRISASEFDLFDEILSCAEEVTRETTASVGRRIGEIGAVAGAVGGIIALVTFFSR